MKNYSLITSIRVDLKSQTPFPITFYDGDPALIEAEVKELAQNVLKPGYPGKSRQAERMPYIGFSQISDQDQTLSGYISIPESECFSRPRIEDVPAECSLSVYNNRDGIILDFKDSQRKLLRRVCLNREGLSQAINQYRKMVADCETIIRVNKLELKKHIPDFDFTTTAIIPEKSDTPEVLNAKFKILHADHYRRDTHNEGMEHINVAMLSQGISLANPTAPQDVAMRVFELVSYLMSDAQDVANYQPAISLSNRRPGQFRSVSVSNSQQAAP